MSFDHHGGGDVIQDHDYPAPGGHGGPPPGYGAPPPGFGGPGGPPPGYGAPPPGYGAHAHGPMTTHGEWRTVGVEGGMPPPPPAPHGHHGGHHGGHHAPLHVDMVPGVEVRAVPVTHAETTLVEQHVVAPTGQSQVYDIYGKVEWKKRPVLPGFRNRLFGKKEYRPVYSKVEGVPRAVTHYGAQTTVVPTTTMHTHMEPVATPTMTPVLHGGGHHGHHGVPPPPPSMMMGGPMGGPPPPPPPPGAHGHGEVSYGEWTRV